MDNVPDTGEMNGSGRGTSKVARSVLSSLFAFAAAFGAAYLFGAGHFPASAPVFFVSALVMTFIFTHQKAIMFSLVPFALGYLAVLLPGVDMILALIALCAILFFSSVTGVLIIRRTEKFYVFLLLSALFFAAFSGILLLLLSDSTGSVTAAAERLSGASKKVLAEMIRISEQNGLSAGAIDSDALSAAVTALVPAAVMIFSMIVSLIFTVLFGLAARVAGTRDLILQGEFNAPRPFALIYILVTLLSFMTGVIPDPWSYVILNVDYVLMAIFFVVGIKSLLRSAKKRRGGGRPIVILIAAAAVAVFFGGTVASLLISILIPLLSYFGAFRSLRPAKDKGTEDNEQ